MDIVIDRNRKGRAFRGQGMVSANNSSRLLLDYKYEQPEKYWEILRHVFGAEGLAISHLKIEMGADINSTSGTEPCVMRSESEKADVSRGAGYILAADAKAINPDLTLDMLFWSEPRWVTNAKNKALADSFGALSDGSMCCLDIGAEEVMEARYKWYIETLKAAYHTYGLKFDYISVNRNERAIDSRWIKYFADRFRKDDSLPYDVSNVKIIAADEENAWWISKIMYDNEDIRDSVDIIGSHYTSHSTEETFALINEYGKEAWFTEGCPPMTDVDAAKRFAQSPLVGINGVLDIASRLVAMYPLGGMTMYEYQPVVAAYYDGVTFCHKQLINACKPWSGEYELESGYYLSRMISRFFKKGFSYIDDACACEASKGGDGHALVDVKDCYMTMTDGAQAVSTMLVNTSGEEKVYTINYTNFANDLNRVYQYEYSDGYSCELINEFIVAGQTNNQSVTITVKPYSIGIVSSIKEELSVQVCNYDYSDFKEQDNFINSEIASMLSLPYVDDFKYTNERTCPRYTTDQGGAFEIGECGGVSSLKQIITPALKAEEWGWTPDPVTYLGDDRWYNYSVSIKATFDSKAPKDINYVGIGARAYLACSGKDGYALKLYANGKWLFQFNGETLVEGISQIGESALLRIMCSGDWITAFIDGKNIVSYNEDLSVRAAAPAGRVAIYSAYCQNYFNGLEVKPAGESQYVVRYDDSNNMITYEGDWKHEIMSSYSNYNRTVTAGERGCGLAFKYRGKGFGLFGANEEGCKVRLLVDGYIDEKDISIPVSEARQIFLSKNLRQNEHLVQVIVTEGRLCFDGIQIEV